MLDLGLEIGEAQDVQDLNSKQVQLMENKNNRKYACPCCGYLTLSDEAG
jgi:rubrerythrin